MWNLKIKAYVANALFSEADRMYNDYLVERLREAFPEIDFYLPQENADINDKSQYANSIMITDGDDVKLLGSEILVAVLDGAIIDEGVACEVGKFSGYRTALGADIPIFGLFTDSRQEGRDNPKKIEALVANALENQFIYRNLYVTGTINKGDGEIVETIYDLIIAIDEYLDSHPSP